MMGHPQDSDSSLGEAAPEGRNLPPIRLMPEILLPLRAFSYFPKKEIVVESL